MSVYIRWPQGTGGGGLSPTLPSGQIYVGNASNVATPQTVSGDATLSNAGVLAVTSVGGSSAANIHSAELAANAATDANTPNTIVKRDGSGNFSAGTITATLNGTATNVSGTVAVNHGGTGITSGTSGGILGFTGTGTVASSALLVANALVLGGGAGSTPSTPVGLGTTTTVLHGNAAGAPSWGAVALAADVSGNLPVTNLNSGTGASASTFWRGDATWGAAVTSVALTVPATSIFGVTGSPVTGSGSLGLTTTGTAFGIPYFSSTSQLASSSAGTATTVLHGNAAGAPTFAAVALAADVSGTLPQANGGTGFSTYTLGDTLYASAANTLSKLAGNTTAVRQFLAQTGTGTVSAAPAWTSFTAPTNQKFTSSSGTYTRPAGVLYIRVRMVGGGGGGAGSGTASAGTGGTATASTFGTTLLVGNPGSSPGPSTSGVAGGSASLGTGPTGVAVAGGGGGGGAGANGSIPGGMGGSSAFGGAGASSAVGVAGLAAATNSGSGGAGAPGGATFSSSPGGSAGGYVDAIITSPLGTYSYVVGAGGAGGSAGTAGSAGGAGAAGVIVVDEYYQ